MKRIIISALFAFNFLNAQQLYLEINKTDGKKEQYEISTLSEINFKTQSTFESELYIKFKDGKTSIIPLASIDKIEFDQQGNLINMFVLGSAQQLNTNNIDSLRLIEKIKQVPKPIIVKDLILDEVITEGLTNPWGIAFIDADNAIFTEKDGRIFSINLKTKVRSAVTGGPKSVSNGQGGLLDVVLHPNFSTNRRVYFTYAASATGGQTTAWGYGQLSNDNKTIENFKEVFRCGPIVNSGNHFGSRIAFDKQGFLYFSTGDRGNGGNSQDSSTHWGKVMRFTDEGVVPNDNPFFFNSGKSTKETWTTGHRNIQGMAISPTTGELWSHEHGPKGGDELNLHKKGKNYGWPLATFGENYNGTIITKDTTLPGYESPVIYWKPSIAPCGMTFIKHSYLTNQEEILIGALAGTHITRLILENNKVVRNIRYMQGYARFRDVRQAPDGRIYALTESPGRLIRLKEKE
jgi:glucose/arabinose dehydrogenase